MNWWSLTRSSLKVRPFSTTSALRTLIWTPEDDEKLIRYVKLYGRKWGQFSEHFSNRQPQTLRYHYMVTLKPVLEGKKPKTNKAPNAEIRVEKSQPVEETETTEVIPFTPEEDELLLKMMKEHGDSWDVIQQNGFSTYTSGQIRSRYSQILNSSNEDWSLRLDNALLKAIKTVGFGDWKAIAKKIKGKTSIECRNRWDILKNEATLWKSRNETVA
ncbi:Myblike DNAbinding domain-containing protein [Basidiobolus ranarum]|uniref:Myblike DNAbinding domain-containing protein n=1 Tax=Basidiobolus ranarum TaxID=34480 RepID=A0ABR2W3Y3_9FUNG